MHQNGCFYILYIFLLNKLTFFAMNFEFVYVYRHIYRKWVFLVDAKCRNTIILTGLTYTSSRKVFHNGCAKRGTYSHQILIKIVFP